MFTQTHWCGVAKGNYEQEYKQIKEGIMFLKSLELLSDAGGHSPNGMLRDL